MRWDRVALVCASAVIGLGGAYLILASGASPRWLVAASGLLIAAGGAATGVILIWLGLFIAEDVRPTLRFRKPVVPLALSHGEPGTIGRRNFRNHPIRFWGGLTIANKFFVGFMLFDGPEYLRLREGD